MRISDWSSDVCSSDLNRAYGNVSVLEDAVLKALNGADGPGIFTPAQLGQAARANATKFGGKKAAARGEIPFSELQSNAQAVLPSTVPNSGTTYRAIAAWLLPTDRQSPRPNSRNSCAARMPSSALT